MGKTLISWVQMATASIRRPSLDTITAGSAVIAKVIGSNDITLTSTGADAGTGDVTLGISSASPSVTANACASFLIMN